MFPWAYCVLGPGGSFPGKYDIALFLCPSLSEQVFMLHDTVVGLWLGHEYRDYTVHMGLFKVPLIYMSFWMREFFHCSTLWMKQQPILQLLFGI